MAKTPHSQCRGPGWIPGQGTRSHMPQLKIIHAAMKTKRSCNLQLRPDAAIYRYIDICHIYPCVYIYTHTHIWHNWDFPGSPVVKILCFHCRGHGSNPWSGQSLHNLCCACMLGCVQHFCDPMDCSPPGSSVHGIFQVRILEWVAISSSRGSSQPRDGNCTADGFFTTEAPEKSTCVQHPLPKKRHNHLSTSGSIFLHYHCHY